MLRRLGRNSLERDLDDQASTFAQIIPMWIGFNTATSYPTNYKTTVCYLPSIDEKPSDLKTVYTVLKRGREIAKLCGQNYNIHTFDQPEWKFGSGPDLANPYYGPTRIRATG